MLTLKERIDNLKNISDEEKNAFILCQNFADIDIINEIFSVKFSLDELEFPFVIRIGKGRYKEFIPQSEWPEDFIDHKIIILPTPKDNESWRYAGIFTKHYDWTAGEWREHWGDSPNNPYLKCFFCEKEFSPSEKLYQCFAKGGLNMSSICCICKDCAYKYSRKVTDFKLSGEDIEIEKWEKGATQNE